MGRKELALMVRVCSWFWDIAAPVLWEELSLGNSPRALELLLPPEVQVNFHKWCKNMRLVCSTIAGRLSPMTDHHAGYEASCLHVWTLRYPPKICEKIRSLARSE